ncbi:MAG: TatD family hydrolase [Nitrososphaerota archaeon]|nr:TatD family hydrolase [Nitrososphaerota archaeon]
MRFVDSHLHLDGDGADATLRFAASAGALLLACGVDRASSESLSRMAGASPDVVAPFVGVHPSEAEREGDPAWLEGAAANASGVGEIGLDPAYSSAGDDGAQMRVFRRQLEVAGRVGKPVQVHSRGAEARCLQILAEYKVPGVLMHWLESEEALPTAMERGYFVSLGPALLYSKRLQRIAGRADPSLILLESDSPVPYAPIGGARGPTLIPSVAFRLAEVRGEPFDEVLTRCNLNALRFLGRKG